MRLLKSKYQCYLFILLPEEDIFDSDTDKEHEDGILGKFKAEGMNVTVEGTEDDSPVLDSQTPSAYIPLRDQESIYWIRQHTLVSSAPVSRKVTHLQKQILSYKNLSPQSSAV